MKKRGFTLVELLAVIAILAILVIMALPAVLRMFRQARIDSFTNEVNTIIRTTRQQYLLDGGVPTTYTNASGSSSKLNLTGNSELKYIVKINGEGKVTKVQVTNGSYCYNKSSSDIDMASSKDVKENDCDLNIDDNYSALTNAVFLPGEAFNIKVKQLAGNDTSENGRATVDTNITAILKSNTEPSEANKTEEHIVSTSDSKKPIYAWYDSGTLYWWSEEEHPSLNEDASHMFRLLINLINISSLSELNASNVTTMYGMFAGTLASPMKINDLTALRNWDTSSVTSIRSMFQANTSLTTLEGLENWDVSNVTTMYGMFMGQSSSPMKINDLTALRNWNVSSVTDMTAMFQENTSLTTLTGLENWDVSNVTNMQNVFYGTSTSPMKISDLTALRNWNVSNVTNMQCMFQANTSLTTLEGLENWNTSNVTNFSYMFSGVKNITSLSALENWDVSNTTNMNRMFADNISLTDASVINDWNVVNVTDFTKMFHNAPVHPEFTKVNGTWDSAGTFTPSN